MGLSCGSGVLKIIFSLCCCLLISSFLWSQEVGTSEVSSSSRDMESQIVLNQDSATADNVSEIEGSSYGVWFFIRTVLVLAVVLALVWAFFTFLKRTSGVTDNSDPYLKKVASLSLSPGKFMYVVTLNSKGYLVGVADNSVNLIAEIDDKELIDAMNLNAPQPTESRSPLDFSALLDKFRTGGTKNQSNKKSGEKFSPSSIVELLQSQRSRLNKGDDDVTP